MDPAWASDVFKGGRTLSIMPTYACQAQCRDCGTVSSPSDRNNLALRTMLSAIDQARDLGFANVVFTGGEATMRWPDLLIAIRHAKSLGFPTRLVSNGHWASDQVEADRHVRQLKEAGLDEINFSTGDEHVRFIPLDRVINGIISALVNSLTLAVMVELRAKRTITKEAILQHPRIALLDESSKVGINLIESPWMPLNPLAVEQYPDGAAVTGDNIAAASGCDSILQTYVVQATGKIGACCGLGMRITPELNVGVATGKAFLREAIREAEEDVLKLLLHYKGPEKILAWAAEKEPSVVWEGLYAHKCQACLRIYKDPQVGRIIRQYHVELLPELLQAAWIEEELYPSLAKSGASEAAVD